MSMFAVVTALLVSTAAADSRISGNEAEAIAIAVRIFKSNQGYKDQEGHPVYGDLKHYGVEVARHGRKLEVVFVPKWAPTEKPHPGGSTDYGWEVHYIIALDQMKILEEHYAR